jgi:pyroglutamyl-peptidase
MSISRENQTQVLVTAFEPYDCWTTNSSWLALMELTRELPVSPRITTRLYPVDYERMRERLERDLRRNYDFVVHLGQSPGASAMRLEAFAINVAMRTESGQCQFQPVCPDGPAAYRTDLPLGQYIEKLRIHDIPAELSHHAGTFLCNAILYWSHYLREKLTLKSRIMFIHLPLDVSQVSDVGWPMACLPSRVCRAGLQLILEELNANSQPATFFPDV